MHLSCHSCQNQRMRKGRNCDNNKLNLLIKLTRHNTYKCTKETEPSNGTAHLKVTIAQTSWKLWDSFVDMAYLNIFDLEEVIFILDQLHKMIFPVVHYLTNRRVVRYIKTHTYTYFITFRNKTQIVLFKYLSDILGSWMNFFCQALTKCKMCYITNKVIIMLEFLIVSIFMEFRWHIFNKSLMSSTYNFNLYIKGNFS